MALQTNFGERSINEFCLLLTNDQINLEPGFQRKSVWSDADRRRLIQSVVAGFPVPSVFLYKRVVDGRIKYDVIDGKQRLETIFMFRGESQFRRQTFEVQIDRGDKTGPSRHSWKTIQRKAHDIRAHIESYLLQTVEVSGDLSEIVDLFVRINSTGKRLTSGEQRHARFYTSDFLKEADRLVVKYGDYLRSEKILSPCTDRSHERN